MKIREMRRGKLQTSQDEALRVLRETDYGVLATVNTEGEPRTVAVNHYLLDDKTLLFHGAVTGEKIENIKENAAVSFFVVAHEKVVAQAFTTDYLSVSVQGYAEIVEDDAVKFDGLVKLSQKFSKNLTDQEIHDYVYPARMGKVALVKIHIEDIKGKYHPAIMS